MEKVSGTDSLRNEVLQRVKEERNVIKLHDFFPSSIWKFYSSFLPLTDCNQASDGPRCAESGIERHDGMGIVRLNEPIWPGGDRKWCRKIVWCCEIYIWCCEIGGYSENFFQDLIEIQFFGDFSAVRVCKRIKASEHDA